MTIPDSLPPLAGVRVLDLTRLLPGPMCTLHLADLGADVVKIEDPGAGDYLREFGDGPGVSAMFDAINRNKRNLCLDLATKAGRQVLLRLARNADVLVEGFRPGVMDRLEVGYADVSAVNPAIVYCSITGYGQTGPHSRRAGHDINYCALAGVSDQIGTDAGLALPNFPIGDLLGGAMSALAGLLAALLAARESGRGRHVDVAITDALLAHNVVLLDRLRGDGRPAPAGGDLLSGAEPGYAHYRTRDGRFMAVGALEKKFWDNMCDALGLAELKACHGRRESVDAVRAALAARFAERTQADWVACFASHDCCVSPVLRLDETVADAHIRAREMVLSGPSGGTQFGPPFRISQHLPPVARAAARRGEHSLQILREAGFDEAEIASLQDDRVI